MSPLGYEQWDKQPRLRWKIVSVRDYQSMFQQINVNGQTAVCKLTFPHFSVQCKLGMCMKRWLSPQQRYCSVACVFAFCFLENSFDLWRIKMCTLLKEQGVWGPLSGTYGKAAKKIVAQHEENTHPLILLSPSNEVLYEVADEDKLPVYGWSWRNSTWQVTQSLVLLTNPAVSVPNCFKYV